MLLINVACCCKAIKTACYHCVDQVANDCYFEIHILRLLNFFERIVQLIEIHDYTNKCAKHCVEFYANLSAT